LTSTAVEKFKENVKQTLDSQPTTTFKPNKNKFENNYFTIHGNKKNNVEDILIYQALRD
jgi:hypothetical protein